MKILKNTAVFVLVCATLLAVCAGLVSCGEDPDAKKGNLVATYRGGELYESDLEDWQQYMYYTYLKDILDADDQKAERFAVLDLATDYVVKMTAFKLLLESEGYVTFTESKINAYVEQLKEQFKKDYKDGYDTWKYNYHVSDGFIYKFAELQLVSQEIEKYVMSKYGVTDKMIDEYWELYAGNYMQVPSYYFDSIILAMKTDDMDDKVIWDELKDKAQGYIDELLAGADFDTVKQNAIASSPNTTVSRIYSVVSDLSKLECRGFEELDDILADNEKDIQEYCEKLEINFVPYADPKGNKNEYEAWYYYVNMNNETRVKNALLSLEVGEVWSEPIMSVFGYQIIKMTKIDEDYFFKRPSDYPEVYDDIYQQIYNARWNDGAGVAVTEFENDLVKKYDIDVKYSYSLEYKKGNLK